MYTENITKMLLTVLMASDKTEKLFPTNLREKRNFGGAKKVRKLSTTIVMESTTQKNTLITVMLMESVIMMIFQLKSIVLLSHACTTIASGEEMNM